MIVSPCSRSPRLRCFHAIDRIPLKHAEAALWPPGVSISSRMWPRQSRMLVVLHAPFALFLLIFVILLFLKKKKKWQSRTTAPVFYQVRNWRNDCLTSFLRVRNKCSGAAVPANVSIGRRLNIAFQVDRVRKRRWRVSFSSPCVCVCVCPGAPPLGSDPLRWSTKEVLAWLDFIFQTEQLRLSDLTFYLR